ncbi:L-asparaginase 1-like [Littorina saxatilis]|uniref:asparaginase n=1 Tax=Littorina saxatilis TaxID=31220 RepID=A0AAN9BCF5_9CAEN
MASTIQEKAEIDFDVLVINTGGTIGMKIREKGEGYVPATKETFQEYLGSSELLWKKAQTTGCYFIETTEDADGPKVFFKMESMEELLDSSNISPGDWNKIAKKIEENYAKYDGFVVLHGTDTMVYTASALSFMCEHLAKPIVFTGAQIPIYEARSDGRDNLINSILVAGTSHIPEVLLSFGSDVFRANRCVKSDNSNLAPFNSPNHNRLIKLGVRVETDGHAVEGDKPADDAEEKSTEFEVRYMLKEKEGRVGILHLYPGITSNMVTAIVDQLDGVVLLSYGAGNAPTHEGFIDILKERDNKLIINVTQCHTGAVTGDYETGKALVEAGVVPGGDITTEAAFGKLCYLLAKTNLSNKQRKEELRKPLCKEMTPNSN